jgi:hypothetical protein
MKKKHLIAALGILALTGFIAFMIWTRIQGPAIDAELFPRPA